MLRAMADKPKETVLIKDKSKGLTLEQKKTVADWLTERWGHARKCPMCETSGWTVGSYLVQPDTLFSDPDATWESMQVGYQFVPVFCRNCGQTVFLNAVVIGLLPARSTSNG